MQALTYEKINITRRDHSLNKRTQRVQNDEETYKIGKFSGFPETPKCIDQCKQLNRIEK